MNVKNNNLGPGRGPLLGLLAVLAVLAAIAVAGCGGSSGDSTSADTSASSGGEAEAGGMPPGGGGPGGFEIDDEARACLEEQGVELPDPGEGGEPPSGEPPQGGPPEGLEGGEDMQKAFEECGIDAPQPGGADGPPTDSPEFRESIEDYVACVRENGYDLPDPNLSGEGPVFDESEVDQDDPEFKAASEECQSLIGAPGGGEG